MMKPPALPLLVFVAMLASSERAQGWMRPWYEDAVVVERSELIVVGHLKEGTIEYVRHKRKASEGASWEHHATLIVTEVLKGTCDEEEIPVIIHYGLTPVVGGFVKRENFMLDSRMGRDDYPKDIIEIIDTSDDSYKLSQISDARADNLWFLRRRSGPYGWEPGAGDYGIVDPEDLQSLEWKEYFLSYLADDPETAIRGFVKKNPERAGRAKSYLDHLEVQRILKIEDTGERYDRLLPYYLNRTNWNMRPEARDGIVACGEIAGERLREVFDDPGRAEFRQDVIYLWREMGYNETVPLLIDLLEKHDRFWAEQDLQEGWWNRDTESEETRRRRNTYGEVYAAVCALRLFQDPRSEEVLKMTRDRWKIMDFENPQILEECEAALEALGRAEEPETGG